MNYKFIQPVSMQVNQEQFEYLSKELEKLGYIADNISYEDMKRAILNAYPESNIN